MFVVLNVSYYSLEHCKPMPIARSAVYKSLVKDRKEVLLNCQSPLAIAEANDFCASEVQNYCRRAQ